MREADLKDAADPRGGSGKTDVAVGPAPRGEDDSLVDGARLRSRIYRWLASAFLPPEPARNSRLLEEARALLADGAALFPYGRALQSAGKAMQAAQEDGRRLAELHTGLFNLPGGRAACPPLGCNYLRHADGSLLERLAELDGFYREIGIEPRDHIRDRPDHISVELDALAVLALIEASSAAEGKADVARAAREAAERFLRLHLSHWLPQFREAVNANDPDGVYATLANAANAFVTHELGYLRVLVEEHSVRPA